MDALQPAGSFKIRGIGHLCEYYAHEGQAKCFVSSSGGNAGIAVSYAGQKLGIPVEVVVPKTSSPLMIDKIKSLGANVTVHGEDWNGADARVQAMLRENEGYAYIPPFNHPKIWDGHASIIREVAAEHIKPDVVIVAVGGGGLLCGIVQGLHEQGWNDVPVIAAETEGAASMAAALKAGEPVTLDSIETVATSLGAKRVCDQAIAWSERHEIISAVVSDKQALDACAHFANEQRVLVEPACGAALAAIKHRYKSPLVIVCGGNGVSLDLVNAWSHNLRGQL